MTDIEKHLNSLIQTLKDDNLSIPNYLIVEFLKLYIDEKFKEVDDRLESHIEYGWHSDDDNRYLID